MGGGVPSGAERLSSSCGSRRGGKSRAAQLHSGNARRRCSSVASPAYGRVRRWDSASAASACGSERRSSARPGNGWKLGRMLLAALATLHSGRMRGKVERCSCWCDSSIYGSGK
ncbi:unnamed protein product [Urochloa humidicola]